MFSRLTSSRAARGQKWLAHCRGRSREYHVAIVGSGPAGFYTSKYLTKLAKETPPQIDMFERLPTPFGLVRFGVAPDHPEVKNVINDFAVVAESPGFRFFGNVDVGGSAGVSLEMLRSAYDAVVVCSGMEGERVLGIPGEELRGVVGAPRFTKWYNSHPDYSELDVGEPGESAVVIGQGNVALDVARMLSRSTAELRQTDIDARAIERVAAWQRNGLRKIDVVGRRGFVQAAFTNAELRELLSFSDEVLPVVDPEELQLCRNPASEEELKKSRMKKRSVDILEKMAANYSQLATTSKRVIQIRFLASPVELFARPDDSSALGGVRLARTRLEGEPGAQRAVATGEVEDVRCGLLVRSVGFGPTPLAGLPFDASGSRVPHTQGRVEAPADSAGGLYVSGWIKRGPTGIIGSNIADAQETAARVLADLAGRPSRAKPDVAMAALETSGRRVVSFADWRRLEAEEQRRGEAQGRPAIKLNDVSEMLNILSNAA